MAILGNNTTPASGSWFDSFGNKEFWTAAAYTMPTGGGVATDMYVYCAGDGSSVTGQLIIWNFGTGIQWQSGNITIPSGTRSVGGQSWVHVSIPNVYLPAGNYELGFWSSGNVVWTFESSGGVNSKSATSPTGNSGGSDEYGGGGFGALGAYVQYNPGGVMYVNTGTPAAPTWTAGVLYINTGTALSPVWTANNGLAVNTGTPAAPTWTPTG